MTLPQHTADNPRWRTPPRIVEKARRALGGVIGCDPSTSAEANVLVQATTIWTEETDGLDMGHAWGSYGLPADEHDTVFLNPDGRLVPRFWSRLLYELREGSVSSAIWVGFSIAQLAILQDASHYPLDFSTVVCRERIDFLDASGQEGGRPSHANYITGLGMMAGLFERCFGDLGRVHHGRRARVTT